MMTNDYRSFIESSSNRCFWPNGYFLNTKISYHSTFNFNSVVRVTIIFLPRTGPQGTLNLLATKSTVSNYFAANKLNLQIYKLNRVLIYNLQSWMAWKPVYNLQLFCPFCLQSTLNILAKSTIYKLTTPPLQTPSSWGRGGGRWSSKLKSTEI